MKYIYTQIDFGKERPYPQVEPSQTASFRPETEFLSGRDIDKSYPIIGILPRQ